MKKKLLFVLVLFFIVSAVFAYLAVYLPYMRIRAKAMALTVTAQEMKKVFSQNDIDSLSKKMNQVEEKYQEFARESSSVYWATFIPYVADYKRGVEAGGYVILAAKESIAAIAPYADLIGFKKGESSFVEKSAEGRLQTAVLTLDKVLTKIDSISENIHQAEQRISAIDESKYPETFAGKQVRPLIAQIKEQFFGVATLFVDAKPFLKKLPSILGANKEKTYLVLFQNDKERRATGGFLTAYAVFKIKDGKMSIDRSEDIYSLDATIAVHPAAPPEIKKYHINVNTFNLRDSNLSPDFVKSIDLFNSLYKKSGARVQYDGIIAIDTKILVDMLTIFGDTEVNGILFSAKTDSRCNCPSVIYRLFELITEEVGYQKVNRKGILGDLMYELFNKALRFSPSRYWGTLAQTMFKNMDEKHILLYFTDTEIQQSIEKLNYAGRINETDSDYLHVNNVNFAGAKSNLFVNEDVQSKTEFVGGRVRRTVEITYKNPFPASNCNRNQERVLCLNAILRNWIRVYVPKGSKLISFNGSEMKVSTYEDLGKTVFDGFLKVTPMGMAKVSVIYELPENIGRSNYSLLFQKQGGVEKQNLTITIDGKKKYSGIFDTDKKVKL